MKWIVGASSLIVSPTGSDGEVSTESQQAKDRPSSNTLAAPAMSRYLPVVTIIVFLHPPYLTVRGKAGLFKLKVISGAREPCGQTKSESQRERIDSTDRVV